MTLGQHEKLFRSLEGPLPFSSQMYEQHFQIGARCFASSDQVGAADAGQGAVVAGGACCAICQGAVAGAGGCCLRAQGAVMVTGGACFAMQGGWCC